MTYVVTDNCIACKYTDCVEVCPVDCFYEGENMLVIHPDECIDCGVCEPECPVDAIKPDTEPGLEKWLELNTEFAKWPNMTAKRDRPADAKEFEGVDGQVREVFFSEARRGRLSGWPVEPGRGVAASASGSIGFGYRRMAKPLKLPGFVLYFGARRNRTGTPPRGGGFRTGLSKRRKRWRTGTARRPSSLALNKGESVADAD